MRSERDASLYPPPEEEGKPQHRIFSRGRFKLLKLLTQPKEVEVDSHPLWGWESKEASFVAPPYGGAKND